jgi:hypothetical protein
LDSAARALASAIAFSLAAFSRRLRSSVRTTRRWLYRRNIIDATPPDRPASALLGGDLEDSGQSNMGWNAILSGSSGRYTGGDVFKVPHHGSPTSHNPAVWQTMLKADPHSVLTPYLVSSLPTDADVRRLRQLTPNLFSTMPRVGNRPRRRDSTVERILAGYQLRSAAGTGQIRIRMDATRSSSPQVELFHGALGLL